MGRPTLPPPRRGSSDDPASGATGYPRYWREEDSNGTIQYHGPGAELRDRLPRGISWSLALAGRAWPAGGDLKVLRGPLRSGNFRLLLASDVSSVTGSAIALVAIPFAVLSIGGSGIDVGDVTTAALVSVLVFLLLGGTVADRLPRHRVMTAANALQGLAQAAAACLVLTGTAHIWELIALSAVRGTRAIRR